MPISQVARSGALAPENLINLSEEGKVLLTQWQSGMGDYLKRFGQYVGRSDTSLFPFYWKHRESICPGVSLRKPSLFFLKAVATSSRREDHDWSRVVAALQNLEGWFLQKADVVDLMKQESENIIPSFVDFMSQDEGKYPLTLVQ